jgi:hypothetical protein
MKIRRFLVAVSMTLAIATVVPSFAGEPQNNGKAPSIEGTYKLISRKLPDGKRLMIMPTGSASTMNLRRCARKKASQPQVSIAT